MMDMFADSLIRKGIRDFSSLIGESVVLIVNIRKCQVPLRCRIVGGSRTYFRP